MKKLFLLALLVLPIFCFAQHGILQKRLDNQGVVKLMVFDSKKPLVPMGRAKQLLRDTLKFSGNDDLVLRNEFMDTLGFTHQSYEQRYKGIKVEDGSYGVHGSKHGIEYINGAFKKVNAVPTTPAISEEKALEKALKYINAAKYRWQIPEEESSIKKEKNDLSATFYPKGELLICKDVLKSNSIFRLAYRFDIFAAEPISHKLYYIDAITGKLLDARDLICDANTINSGSTLYSGTVNITTDSYPNGFRLQETRLRNSFQIQTFNAGNTNLFPLVDFTNATTTWTAGPEIDVHWGIERVFDYWYYGRQWNSYNNEGGIIKSWVHYGQNWDGARWTGSEFCFGDGFADFKSVVSLDIIAHESGHAVLNSIVYLSDTIESSALMEGFSDIWGAVIEHYYYPNSTSNWLIGEQIMKNGAICLRSLKNPKHEGFNPLTNYLQGGYPSTYKGTNWNTSNEGHINSTVLSHWFYLLSQGGSDRNDLGDEPNVSGIGIDQAASIVWRVESIILNDHPNAGYSDVMEYTILAAQNIFGEGSFEEIMVKNAWFAVGVGSRPTMSLCGPNSICSSSATYTVYNAPAGATFSWSGYNIYPSVATGNPVVFTPNGISNGWVEVQVSGSGGGTIRKDIVVGLPFISSQTPLAYFDGYSYNNVCNLQPTTTSMIVNGSPAVTWSRIAATPSNTDWYQSGNDIYFYFYNVNQTAVYRISASNGCGTTSYDFGFQSINCGGGGGCNAVYSISPNPSKNKVKIIPQIPAPCFYTTVISTQNGYISIYDQQGNLKKKLKYSYNSAVDIDVSSLKEGLYIVEIYDGNSTVKQTIIVKH